MKKLFVLLLLGLSLGLAGCWPDDCGHNFLPELRAAEASILTANFDPFGFSEREFNPKFTKTFPSVNLK